MGIFLQELLSVVFAPLVLCLSLPESADQIVDFFREFTVHVNGLGYVCSFAQFDFMRHGNVKYGVQGATVDDEYYLSKQGKMEKSFLNFKVISKQSRVSIELNAPFFFIFFFIGQQS